MSRDTEAHQRLKTQLKITPKTADTLIKAGYSDCKQLADVSPQIVAKQFGDILKLPKAQVVSYQRAFRRIIWVSTQKSPENHNEACKNWSNKALMARGLWSTDFDSLTGREIDAKVKEVEGHKIVAKDTQKHARKAIVKPE